MARIFRTDIYDYQTLPTFEDYVIGTDPEDSNRTRNFRIADIIGLANGTATNFTTLFDTPVDYVGQAGKTVMVNGTEDGLIFGESSNDEWGTSRDISIGVTSKSVNGSANVTWTIDEIGIRKSVIDALNIDADTLDSLNSTQFLRSDENDTMTGNLTVTGTITAGGRISAEGTVPFISLGTGLRADNTAQNYMLARDSANTPLWYIGTVSTANNDVAINNQDGGAQLLIKEGGDLNGLEYGDGTISRTVWHSGNQPVDVQPTANTLARRDAAGRLEAVELEINNTIRLSNSGDRPGLLQSWPLSVGAWAGFQIRNNPSNQYWSFLGTDTQCGVFDDTNNKWVWLHSENGGMQIFHNNNIRLTTTNAGVTINGTSTANDFILSGDDAYDESSWNGNLEVPSKNAIRDKIESLSPNHTTYVARITQSGTSNPSVTALYDNSSGYTWRRDGVGVYRIIPTVGANHNPARCHVVFSQWNNSTQARSARVVLDSTFIQVVSVDGTTMGDGLLNGTIKIEQY